MSKPCYRPQTKINNMRPPIKANLLLLKNGNIHLGILVNPRTKTTLDIMGMGKFEILGKLKDKGYEFGNIIDKFPKWVNEYLPQEYFLYGMCLVISMPFTHPNDCKCDDCRANILEKQNNA